MYVYVYVYVYVHVCMYVCVFECMCMCTCMCTCMCMCTCTRMCMCTGTCLCMCVCMYVRVCVCVCTYSIASQTNLFGHAHLHSRVYSQSNLLTPTHLFDPRGGGGQGGYYPAHLGTSPLGGNTWGPFLGPTPHQTHYAS